MSAIRSWLLGLGIALAALVAGPQVLAQQSADELADAEAFALGYQAYITGAVYARSQLLMEYDSNPNAPLNAPINAFNIYPELATPDTAIDFTPNNDTFYGPAWLDLRQGPEPTLRFGPAGWERCQKASRGLNRRPPAYFCKPALSSRLNRSRT
jgi:Protein of unknown function (DUF1254)